MEDRDVSRQRVGNSFLIMGSILVALLLTEASLRLAGITFPVINRFSPDIGNALLPGAEGWYTREGRSYVRINSDGLRDREHAIAKPPDTLRIAVLGDSYAEAIQVSMEETFWAVLERQLARCKALGGQSVEVINLGVAGYGTAQELLTLRYKGWKYDPDIVLLAFFAANDIRNNSRALQRGGRPYFIYDGAELVLDDSFLEKTEARIKTSAAGEVFYWVLPKSRLLQLMVEAGSQLWRFKRSLQAAADDQPQLEEPGLDSTVYRVPDDPAWIDAWKVTEEILRTTAAEVKTRNAQLLIVTVSDSIQVNPDKEVRRRFAEALGVPDLYYPDRRIRALAAAEGIPAIQLAPALRRWAEEHDICVHGFANAIPCGGHWNEHGHRLAGELIASKICRDLL